jgi:ribosome biogenesis GTPase
MADLPTVGDWVALQLLPGERKASLQAVLPRRTKFSRKAAGKDDDEQIVAANVDYVFVTSALNAPPNLRRLERYLTLAWESGAQPVVVFTKADLCQRIESTIEDVRSRLGSVPVHAVSGVTGQGLDVVRAYLAVGSTAALMGPSGVGKSTLINHLRGEDLFEVQPVRAWDEKGRHTTTRRQLVVLPGGGLIIDTPGLRELQIWEAGLGIGGTFGDIEEIAARCRFSNCLHDSEPGCAVRVALAEGTVNPDRFRSYCKLRDESRSREERFRYLRARNRERTPRLGPRQRRHRIRK